MLVMYQFIRSLATRSNGSIYFLYIYIYIYRVKLNGKLIGFRKKRNRPEIIRPLIFLSLLSGEYFIRRIIFLFIAIALLANALRPPLLIIVFSRVFKINVPPTRGGNNNFPLRRANRVCNRVRFITINLWGRVSFHNSKKFRHLKATRFIRLSRVNFARDIFQRFLYSKIRFST